MAGDDGVERGRRQCRVGLQELLLAGDERSAPQRGEHAVVAGRGADRRGDDVVGGAGRAAREQRVGDLARPLGGQSLRVHGRRRPRVQLGGEDEGAGVDGERRALDDVREDGVHVPVVAADEVGDRVLELLQSIVDHTRVDDPLPFGPAEPAPASAGPAEQVDARGGAVDLAPLVLHDGRREAEHRRDLREHPAGVVAVEVAGDVAVVQPVGGRPGGRGEDLRAEVGALRELPVGMRDVPEQAGG